MTGFGLATTTVGTQFITVAPFGQVDQLGVTGEFGPLDIACVIAGNATVSGARASTDGYTLDDQPMATFTACARGREILNGDQIATTWATLAYNDFTCP